MQVMTTKRARTEDKDKKVPDHFHILMYCTADMGLLHFSLQSDDRECFKWTVREMKTLSIGALENFVKGFRENLSTNTSCYPGVWTEERLDGQSEIYERDWTGETYLSVIFDVCAGD